MKPWSNLSSISENHRLVNSSCPKIAVLVFGVKISGENMMKSKISPQNFNLQKFVTLWMQSKNFKSDKNGGNLRVNRGENFYFEGNLRVNRGENYYVGGNLRVNRGETQPFFILLN